MDSYLFYGISCFLVLLSDTYASTSLYCRFEQSYYEVGQSWKHHCHRYNCTLSGVISEPLYQCPPPAAPTASEWCSPVVEPTDTQSCCTDQVFCQEMVLPPNEIGDDSAGYSCPEGWTSVNYLDREEAYRSLCMKRYDLTLPYEKAKETCRVDGAFLVNLDTPNLVRTILDSSSLRETLLTPEVFWTGAHGDGRMFIWDGVQPTIPELNFLCPSIQSEPISSIHDVPNNAWGCDYEKQWAELAADSEPCIAAKISTTTFSSATVNITQLVLDPCEQGHQFVCAGDFSQSQIFQLFPNSTCGDGWLWNPLTHICVQYIESANSMPNYFAAMEDCRAKEGSLYNIDSKEKEFLLYEIMKSQKVKPYSVWISEECVGVVNPYIAVTASLQTVKQSISCYTAMPYVCEKLPDVFSDKAGEATLELSSNTLKCKLDGEVAEHAVIIGPLGDILSDNSLSGLTVDQSGTYHCLVWSEMNSTYIYSNVINIDGDGSTLPLVVTIPLDDIPWQSWHRMVGYYSFTSRKAFPTLDEIKNAYSLVLEPAFQLAKSIMLNPELCPTCANDSFIDDNTRMSLSSISSISAGKDSGIVATGLVILSSDGESSSSRQKRQAEPETSDESYISDIETQLANSIINVLELEPSKSDSVLVTLSGQCSDRVMYVEELDISISLPVTSLYEEILMSMCANTGTPIVSATCESGVGGGGVWNIIINPCEQETVSEATLRLRTLSLTPVDSSNFISVLTETSTLVGADSTAADVAYTAEILSSVTGFPLLTQQDVDQYFEAFIETLQNLMDVSSEAIDKADNTTQSSVRVVSSLEVIHTTYIAPELLVGNLYESVKPNIAYRLTVEKDIFGVMLLEEDLNAATVTYANSSEGTTAIDNEKIVGLFLRDVDIGSVRRAFTVFGNKKFHKSAEQLKSVDQIVAASIVMADGTPADLSNSFNDLVSIHYPQTVVRQDKTVNGSQFQCGFWETEEAVWATGGCITVFDEVNGVSCSCNHLTDFSVLLDLGAGESAADPALAIHSDILSIITYIGLYASIITLSLVLGTAILYRRFRKTNSQKVLAMLALCLLGRDVTFVAGIEQTQSYAGCVTVAVVIHYFVLASFAWMFVEGIIQYLRFVKVLGTYIPKFMLKSSIPAFTIPLVIVVITLIVDVDLYKASDDFCWMKREAIIYAVMVPVGLVLVANIIIFIVVICSLIKARRSVKMLRSTQSARKADILQLVACIGVFVVLGLSWVFGYLTVIITPSIVFNYLFCIFNTTQGLLIFIFHNIREPSVQEEWKKLFNRVKKTADITLNGVEVTNSQNGTRQLQSDNVSATITSKEKA